MMQELYKNYHCPECGTVCVMVDDPKNDFIIVKCPKCNEEICIMERRQPWTNHLDFQSADPYYSKSNKGWVE